MVGGKRRQEYHTKPYTDWSRVAAQQDGRERKNCNPGPSIISRINYNKSERETPGPSPPKRLKKEAEIAHSGYASSEEIEETQEYVEEHTITTVIIDNSDNSIRIKKDLDNLQEKMAPSKNDQNSIMLHLPDLHDQLKLHRRHNTAIERLGVVKTEKEAKILADPFIGKTESKPLKWKCLFDSCAYENSRHLMTLTHVYKHLDIFTHLCPYCNLKCRLETNFEKHLNTHGLTRRKEKVGKFTLMGENGYSSSVGTELDIDRIISNKTITVASSKPENSFITPDISSKEMDEGHESIAENTVEKKTNDHEDLLTQPKDPNQIYHTIKKAVFLEEDKARSIISSYILYNMSEDQSEVDFGCSLCDFVNESEIEIYEHIALTHLNIYQYKCDFCSLKMKIKRQLIEHMIEKHGKLERRPDTAENSDVIVSSNNDVDSALKVPAVLPDENLGDEDSFPYADYNMTVIVGPNKSKRVFVGNAKYPLLRLNRSVLNKLARGKIVSKTEADDMVSGYAMFNEKAKAYECSLCNGKVQKVKLYLIQRHLYEHFNLYFMKCDKCNDLFRYPTQFKEHQEAHRKAISKEIVRNEDKIGDYHKATEFILIPAEEAKEIVESYFVQNQQNFACKLCAFTASSQVRTFNHCLKDHLKIYQYKCDVCGSQFQLDVEMKKHYRKDHGKEFKKNLKLDKLSKNEKHYESLETDFPEISGNCPHISRLFLFYRISYSYSNILRRFM